jgi:hypothetical protein
LHDLLLDVTVFDKEQMRKKKASMRFFGAEFFCSLSCFFMLYFWLKKMIENETIYTQLNGFVVINSEKLSYTTCYLADHVRCDVDACVVCWPSLFLSLSLDRTYGRIGESSNEEGYCSFIRARICLGHTHIYSV